jgi:hypothetical protein
MNIEQAIEGGNEWVSHARPIIKAYLAMEEACMASAICEVHYGRDDMSKARTRDYREADGYRKDAQRRMYDMLEGIRDNYRCDYYRNTDSDASEAVWDENETFNDDLERGMISVDAAVRMVEDENV